MGKVRTQFPKNLSQIVALRIAIDMLRQLTDLEEELIY
jgi:hypothetical protein